MDWLGLCKSYLLGVSLQMAKSPFIPQTLFLEDSHVCALCNMAGKTYTMIGGEEGGKTSRGLLGRSVDYIFEALKARQDTHDFKVMECYSPGYVVAYGQSLSGVHAVCRKSGLCPRMNAGGGCDS